MATTTTDRRIALARHGKLTELFIEELGWDRLNGPALPITMPAPQADGEPVTFTLRPVAEKRGVQVYACDPDTDGVLPADRQRRALDRALAKRAFEHLIVFHNDGWSHQIWQWTDNEPGSPRRQRTIEVRPGQTGEQLRQALGKIAFAVDEEEALTLLDVIRRLKDAVPPDRVTRRFYDQFSKERVAFEGFIEGIAAQGDREWYASLMLNRLMFVYFIQQKEFLDNDPNYLQDRLARVKAGELPVASDGSGFLTFYRAFLRHLFHDALAQPKAERELAPALARFMGDVPYLNGGLFDVHDIEAHGSIDIADKAFERLFAFFGRFQWHLDDRPVGNDWEINPDVLGYIFEKFINQKEMGAYYTKEDITGYICQNTILPWVLDAAKRECAVAFRPEEAGNVWELLRDDPDRYLYPAVKRGVIDADGAVIPLPAAIAAGVDDVTQRGGWNARADEPFGLPTETWREHVHRRQRCLELRAKLAAGEIHSVDDLITWNLDIRQFAQDAIDRCEGPELLRALYKAIRDVTVLDPTCGSGAFLFAALNVLFPLHDACLERMRGFLDDLAREPAHRPEKYRDFREAIDLVAQHPSQDYHVLRQIALNNLYGVDIMPEAVEICKLRLFLKLVAQLDRPEQIEPLPDIDFNIRAGNSLVGFVTHGQVKAAIKGKQQIGLDLFDDMQPIEEKATLADRAYQHFKRSQDQSEDDKRELREAKAQYRQRLDELRGILHGFLAKSHGVKPEDRTRFGRWCASHQPFHWFVDFHSIIDEDGGFDVVVGNPPYIARSKVEKQYALKGFETERCTDVYALVMERVVTLLNVGGRSGMIVPLSLTFSGDFRTLREVLHRDYGANWFSSYARIPAALFAHDVRVRNTIHVGRKGKGNAAAWTTVTHRWYEAARPHLMENLEYAAFTWGVFNGCVPKFNTSRLAAAWIAVDRKYGGSVQYNIRNSPTNWPLNFRTTAYNWLSFTPSQPPAYGSDGNLTAQTMYSVVYCESARAQAVLMDLFNGKYGFAYWSIVGDDFHVTKGQMTAIPFSLSLLGEKEIANLEGLSKQIVQTLPSTVTFKANAGKRIGSYNLARCRDLTDQSDHMLAGALGLCDVWEDIELLYTQVVKTDFDDDCS